MYISLFCFKKIQTLVTISLVVSREKPFTLLKIFFAKVLAKDKFLVYIWKNSLLRMGNIIPFQEGRKIF